MLNNVVVPLEEKRCDHFDLCDYAKSGGCTISSMSACSVAIEIKERATKWPCVALPGSHCEIPNYLVLMKRGIPCGKKGKCLLAETLKGAIPAQDVTSTGKIPENYRKPRFGKKILCRILTEDGML